MCRIHGERTVCTPSATNDKKLEKIHKEVGEEAMGLSRLYRPMYPHFLHFGTLASDNAVVLRRKSADQTWQISTEMEDWNFSPNFNNKLNRLHKLGSRSCSYFIFFYCIRQPLGLLPAVWFDVRRFAYGWRACVPDGSSTTYIIGRLGTL